MDQIKKIYINITIFLRTRMNTFLSCHDCDIVIYPIAIPKKCGLGLLDLQKLSLYLYLYCHCICHISSMCNI